MGQLNVYVPDELEEKIKKEAKREGKSVSAFVLEAVKHRVDPESWNEEFLKTFGAAEDLDLEEPEDAPPQKRRPLGKL
jgi:predicted transcriptional regulator